MAFGLSQSLEQLYNFDIGINHCIYFVGASWLLSLAQRLNQTVKLSQSHPKITPNK